MLLFDDKIATTHATSLLTLFFDYLNRCSQPIRLSVAKRDYHDYLIRSNFATVKDIPNFNPSISFMEFVLEYDMLPDFLQHFGFKFDSAKFFCINTANITSPSKRNDKR